MVDPTPGTHGTHSAPGVHDDDRFGLRTYLTPEEAKEFHKLFMGGFLGFTAVAVVAHILVWFWRPWL